MAKLNNITGKKFGRLTVVGLAGRDKWRYAMWECECECGSVIITSGNRLRFGRTRSCGCFQKEETIKRSTIHGEYQGTKCSPELKSYQSAKGRCDNPNNEHYSYYGGRGIEFRFKSFVEFLEEVGRKPSPEHSIDRIDNNGHYEPGNVRWAAPKEQAINRRPRRRGYHRKRVHRT